MKHTIYLSGSSYYSEADELVGSRLDGRPGAEAEWSRAQQGSETGWSVWIRILMVSLYGASGMNTRIMEKYAVITG